MVEAKNMPQFMPRDSREVPDALFVAIGGKWLGGPRIAEGVKLYPAAWHMRACFRIWNLGKHRHDTVGAGAEKNSSSGYVPILGCGDESGIVGFPEMGG